MKNKTGKKAGTWLLAAILATAGGTPLAMLQPHTAMADTAMTPTNVYTCYKTMYINGVVQHFDAPLMEMNGVVLAPIRGLAEGIGGDVTVSWDSATQTVTFTNGTKTVSLVIGQDTYTVDGVINPLPAPAVIVNNRTLIPAQPIATEFGAAIRYDLQPAVVYDVHAGDGQIFGKGEPNAAITVKAGDRVIGTSTMSADGFFNAVITPQAKGTVLTVELADADNDTPASTSVTVQDALPTRHMVDVPSTVSVNSNGSDWQVPSDVHPHVFFNTKDDGTVAPSEFLQVQLLNDQGDIALPSTYADAVFQIHVDLSQSIVPFDPVFVIGRQMDTTYDRDGMANGWSYDPQTQQLTLYARLGSFAVDNDGDGKAEHEHANSMLMAVGQFGDRTGDERDRLVAVNRGLTIETNAEGFGLPEYVQDGQGGRLSEFVEGPHLKSDGSLNVGHYKAFLPPTLLQAWQITSVDQLRAAIGDGAGNANPQAVAYDATGTSADGMTMALDNFTYSAHTITVQKVDPQNVLKVDGISNTTTTVTGLAAPNATITVKRGTATVGTGRANAAGQFSLYISVQQLGAALTVTSTSGPTVLATLNLSVTYGAPVVSRFTDHDTTLRGQASPKSTVQVLLGNQVLQTVTASTSGTFTAQIPKQAGGTVLTVTSADNAQHFSQTQVTVADTTAPNVPTVDVVAAGNTTVTGAAEALSTVVVNQGRTTLGQVKVGPDGKFSVQIPAQKAGTTLSVVAKDDAGNASRAVTVFVKDLTAPDAPSINDVKDTDSAVRGTAEPRAKVIVKLGGHLLGFGYADAKGNYAVTVHGLLGGQAVRVTATDAAGNESVAATKTITDTLAPQKPTVNFVKENSTTATGVAEMFSTVTVQKDDTVLGTATADQDGTFSVTLSEGQAIGTTLSVTATDGAGHISQSTTLQVVEGVAPDAPQVTDVKDTDRVIKGTTEVNATVNVYHKDVVIAHGKADRTGKFQIAIPTQYGGTVLNVTASDMYNNESVATVVKVIDTVAPTKPTVTSVKSGATAITGHAEANTALTVVVGSKTYTGTVGDDGTFTVTVDAVAKGVIIQVSVTDGAGKVSPIWTQTVR